MLRKSLFLLLSMVLFGSCQSVNPAEKPKTLLSAEKMEQVLTDMILLDAILSVNSKKIEEHQIDASNFIFNKYQIDSLTLSQNIEYYNEVYSTNAVIYDKVKTNIETLKQRLEQDKKLKDSLQKAVTQQKKITDSLKLKE